MEKAKEINQIIKDNSYMFIPFNFLESNFVNFEDIEKPENEFKLETVFYKTMCFIFGLKDEEKRLAFECINYDLIDFCGINALESLYTTGEIYGVEGEVMALCFHFFMKGGNLFEGESYNEVKDLSKKIRERIKR